MRNELPPALGHAANDGGISNCSGGCNGGSETLGGAGSGSESDGGGGGGGGGAQPRPQLVRPVAEVLQRLGAGHIMVVHSKDGLDEISLATATYACELKNGEIREFEITPEDVGIQRQDLTGLSVDSAAASLGLIKDALGKRETDAGKKAADILALNAGAAIYVAGLANNFKAGVDMAEDAIYSGLALEKIKELASFSKYIAEDGQD